MNDFTKEELQDIYDAVMDTSLAMFENLPSKIDSLIDNYCEHEWINGPYGFDACEKCRIVKGKLMDYECPCTHDPRETKGAIGMYHCPKCGEMQIAGFKHT